MGVFIISLLIFSIASCNLWVGNGENIFNVLSYGAKGDGQSDDSKAFGEAWEAMCRTTGGTTIPTLLVPSEQTFYVSQRRFTGPCKSNQVHIQILGNLLAPVRDEWGTCSRRWLYFKDVNGMTVNGSGVINGRGDDWWGNLTTGCTGRPTALLFERCNDLQISGLTHMNGPGFHIHVVHSRNVEISNINITAPEHSLNTDGIDTTNVEGIVIRDSVIGTGDDCIAIKGGTRFLNISNIKCGPGHGISVGSIGDHGQEEYASDIHVRNCSITGATRGVRIKTWAGGKGSVERVTFEHITVKETNYPVLIDQHYAHSEEQPVAVKVSDVTFSDINGTSTTQNAIVLDCANIGCENIILNQINITSIDPTKPASTICNNVKGKATNISPTNSSCFTY